MAALGHANSVGGPGVARALWVVSANDRLGGNFGRALIGDTLRATRRVRANVASTCKINRMTTVGYGRVSTRDQTPDAQHDSLRAAGCEEQHIYLDIGVSGRLASRPEWDRCRHYLRDGDVLVVSKLDRLGRSVKNLIAIIESLEADGVQLRVLDQGVDTTTPAGKLFFHMVAAFSEFEHAMIVERTMDGLAAARARGRKGGGVPKMNARQIARARELYDAKVMTVAEIGKQFSVSRQTIYRALEKNLAA